MTTPPTPDNSPNQPAPHRVHAARSGPRDHGPADPDSDRARYRTRHVNRNRADLSSGRDASRHADDGGGRGGEDAHGGRHHGDRGGALGDQIRGLIAGGGTYRSIASAAGLSPATVHDIAAGRQTPTPHTARALAPITSASLRRARTDAGGTRLRLRALHVMGHSSARIARALGVREMTIRTITRGDAATVSTTLRDDIAELYDAWWDKRAPERTRAERAAATAARRRAIAGNWCPGAGLDDDQLDTPGYKPASKWKPAAGTGTAAGIQPPDRPRRNRSAVQPGNGPTIPANHIAAQPGNAGGARPWR